MSSRLTVEHSHKGARSSQRGHCGPGWRSIRRIGPAPGAASGSPTVPTTTRPAWLPARESSRATPGYSRRRSPSPGHRHGLGPRHGFRTGSAPALVVEAIALLRRHETLITADAGDYREANLKALASAAIPALIADTAMRGHDERFEMTNASRTRAATRRSRTCSTTRASPRKKPGASGRPTSTTSVKPAPASVRPARPCTRKGRTVSTTATWPPDSPAASGMACPVGCGLDA